MPVPDYQALMRPLLDVADTQPMHVKDAAEEIATALQLSVEDREELLPSGKKTKFYDRVHWAKTYLKQAGLLAYPKRAHFVITPEGEEFRGSHTGPIGNDDLKSIAAFQDFQNRSNAKDKDEDEEHNSAPLLSISDQQTPDEQILALHTAMNDELAAELIERVQAMPPVFFEQLLVKLLVRMGYGGSFMEAGQDLGKSGDGGVDGVIDQDRLGVDQIYIQAKRYADGNPVGAGAIRDFFGALNMKRATKGIFFTTSVFTKSARETAAALGTRIVLINGRQLARLMIEAGVGCREETTLVIHRIDEDFFDNA